MGGGPFGDDEDDDGGGGGGGCRSEDVLATSPSFLLGVDIFSFCFVFFFKFSSTIPHELPHKRNGGQENHEQKAADDSPDTARGPEDILSAFCHRVAIIVTHHFVALIPTHSSFTNKLAVVWVVLPIAKVSLHRALTNGS